MPRLMHSDSAGLLELVLANFSNRNVSATRFAAELSVVQFSPNDFNSTSNSSVEVKETSSINDEFSPGVFRVS